MLIEVGKRYLNCQNDIITIKHKDEMVRGYIYLGSDMNWYDEDGETSIWGRGMDLVEEYTEMTEQEHRNLYRE